MEVDSGPEHLLGKLAAGGTIEKDEWPGLRGDILARLDEIAHNEFPIPNLPPPIETREPRLMSPLASSPLEEHASSQDADKENAPVQSAEPQHVEPGKLPKQIADQLARIVSHLQTFSSYPPHTIQRLAELILSPRAHYKALASYLHAVDRVVQVTSGTNIYPLPPAVPDMSLMSINGSSDNDPAASVAWGNPTTALIGSDEALGGALLTPIPWLTSRSPDSPDDAPGAQIHSESTETIDGPNGMGSIETVSVSVNGVPSMGHARGITQGELLRQEQRAGVVPVSQLTRSQVGEHERAVEDRSAQESDEDEVPHARGPEEIGVGDTGLQGVTTSYVGEGGGVNMQGIDVEAAVGRRHTDEEKSESEAGAAIPEEDATERDAAQSQEVENAGILKRDAEQALESDTLKKVKEVGAGSEEAGEEAGTEAAQGAVPQDGAVGKEEVAKEEQGEKIKTDG